MARKDMGTSVSNPDEIKKIRDLYQQLCSGPQHLDFQLPSMASHANDYASNPARLKRYARQVINGRIMLFSASALMNTQLLLQGYLLAADNKLALPMFHAARSQIELCSVVVDVVRVITSNSGEQADRFLERVRIVDEALIKATFGTRWSVLQEAMKTMGLSRLRESNEDDINTLNSANVLSRLKKVAQYTPYKACMQDYERLSEVCHPNIGLNLLHMIKSPKDERLSRLSLTSSNAYSQAIKATATCMRQAAVCCVEQINEMNFPFGEGDTTRI